MTAIDTEYLRGLYEGMGGFKPDLQSGVNRHNAVTLTTANTNYTVELPDDVRLLTMYSEDLFQYAIDEPDLGAKATGTGNQTNDDWGIGGSTSQPGQITHILPEGTDRVLTLRGSQDAQVVELQVA